MRDRGILVLAALFAGAIVTACSPPATAENKPPRGEAKINETVVSSDGSVKLVGEVWVDNWFTLYVGGTKLIEDSVPITTERSFNAERVTFSTNLPTVIAFELRDFMENETGLEYIGTNRQQLGDGGAIAQFRDAGSGDLVAVTDADWRCLVVQHAPAELTCARERNPSVDISACAPTIRSIPKGWTLPIFDDRNWPKATVHSASAVNPKGGYDRVTWDPAARFIWGPDLERDNVVLCRVTIHN